MAAVEKVAEFLPGATGTLASPVWPTFKKNADKKNRLDH